MRVKYLKPLIKAITNTKQLRAVGQLMVDGYLVQNGWWQSFIKKQPINSKGRPIPWLSYPFIDYLAEKDLSTLNIFEYGAGNSSLYFASRAKSVCSVEYDKSWYNLIKTNSPSNAQLIFEADVDSEGYYNAPSILQRKFDIILVDGRNRNKCCEAALNHLSEQGVIVLDNSDRPEYREAFEFLHKAGFKHINFWGMAPGFIDTSCTTVFYKNGAGNNCLNI